MLSPPTSPNAALGTAASASLEESPELKKTSLPPVPAAVALKTSGRSGRHSFLRRCLTLAGPPLASLRATMDALFQGTTSGPPTAPKLSLAGPKVRMATFHQAPTAPPAPAATPALPLLGISKEDSRPSDEVCSAEVPAGAATPPVQPTSPPSESRRESPAAKQADAQGTFDDDEEPIKRGRVGRLLGSDSEVEPPRQLPASPPKRPSILISLRPSPKLPSPRKQPRLDASSRVERADPIELSSDHDDFVTGVLAKADLAAPQAAPSFNMRPSKKSELVPDAKPFVLSADGEEPVVEVPAHIAHHLRDYQREGVKVSFALFGTHSCYSQFLYSLFKRGRGGILADDMGLGKTLQTIAFISALLRKSKEDFRTRIKGVDPVLIVAPASVWRSHWSIAHPSRQVLANWCKEGEKWGMRHFFEYRGKDRSEGAPFSHPLAPSAL
jgi:hypothetical protein